MKTTHISHHLHTLIKLILSKIINSYPFLESTNKQQQYVEPDFFHHHYRHHYHECQFNPNDESNIVQDAHTRPPRIFNR